MTLAAKARPAWSSQPLIGFDLLLKAMWINRSVIELDLASKTGASRNRFTKLNAPTLEDRGLPFEWRKCVTGGHGEELDFATRLKNTSLKQSFVMFGEETCSPHQGNG